MHAAPATRPAPCLTWSRGSSALQRAGIMAGAGTGIRWCAFGVVVGAADHARVFAALTAAGYDLVSAPEGDDFFITNRVSA